MICVNGGFSPATDTGGRPPHSEESCRVFYTSSLANVGLVTRVTE